MMQIYADFRILAHFTIGTHHHIEIIYLWMSPSGKANIKSDSENVGNGCKGIILTNNFAEKILTMTFQICLSFD